MRRILFFAMVAMAAASNGQGQAPVKGSRSLVATRARQSEDQLRTARQFLEATMRLEPLLNIRVIVSQRLYYNSSVFQQVKVEMSRDGKLRQLVLAPLSMQGMELVDDGRKLITYTPDDKRVIEQPSAQKNQGEITFRMNLVDQNYTLKFDRKERIAGRQAVVVKAVPRDDALETRCYAVDEKTGFLLRFETCSGAGAPMLHLDTKMIEFPADFSPGTFTLDPGFSRTETFHSKCVSPKSAGDLADELGFVPAIPEKLPHGFEAQELQASTDSPARALIVRITDGLAKATVLEWRKVGSARSKAPAGTVVGSSGGLTLLVSGDLPDDVKTHILRAFAAAAQNRENELVPGSYEWCWAQELACDLRLFPLKGDSREKAPMIVAIPAIVRT